MDARFVREDKILLTFFRSCPLYKMQLYFYYWSQSTPSQKRALQKLFSNQRNLKMPALRFSVDGKYFEKGAFQMQHQVHVMATYVLKGFFSASKINLIS